MDISDLWPAQAGTQSALHARLFEEAALPDSRMLLVEADRKLAQEIEGLFGKFVFALQTADTVFQARRMVECSVPDVIVLDRDLPDGDGVELCAQIKSQSRSRGVPILMLGADMGFAGCERAFAAGGDDYLAKPIALAELLVRVSAVMRRLRRGATRPL